MKRTIISLISLMSIINFFILNTLDFWTGSNPIPMKVSEAVNLNEGQVKLIHPDGKAVEVRL